MNKVRVMTLQEVFKTKHKLVCEFRYGIPPQTFQLRDVVRWLKQGRGYGGTWRCWTQIPGDLLRMNTPWVEETKEKRIQEQEKIWNEFNDRLKQIEMEIENQNYLTAVNRRIQRWNGW